MATTLPAVQILLVGIRDTTGAPVASGKARFYQPGTTTSQTVYQDNAGATPYTQPITLNAAGQATVYTLEPVRMIVKDTTETTTYVDTTPNLHRHDAEYITHTAVNGGTETTLENYFGLVTDTTIAAYLESTGATSRSFASWMRDMVVSVKDFGALGDDTQDDTTYIQAAIDHCVADSKPVLFFPKGTYKTTAALSITGGKVSVRGAGYKNSLIKNYGTTTGALAYTLGGATDYGCFVENIGFTASTTTTGAALASTNANYMTIRNVETALHRTGFSFGSATGTTFENVSILSTDGNSAGVGIIPGPSAIIRGGWGAAATGTVISTSSINILVDGFTVGGASGTGIGSSGARTKVSSCKVTANCTTGITLTGDDSKMEANEVTGTCTTALSLAATRGIAVYNNATGSTTDLALGAADNMTACFNRATVITIHASATGLKEFGNTYTTLTDSANLSGIWLAHVRENVGIQYLANSTNPYTLTPSVAAGNSWVYYKNEAAGTVNIANTATTGLAVGDALYLIFAFAEGGPTTLSWGTQYISSALSAPASLPTQGQGVQRYAFRWKVDSNGDNWFLVDLKNNMA